MFFFNKFFIDTKADLEGIRGLIDASIEKKPMFFFASFRTSHPFLNGYVSSNGFNTVLVNAVSDYRMAVSGTFIPTNTGTRINIKAQENSFVLIILITFTIVISYLIFSDIDLKRPNDLIEGIIFWLIANGFYWSFAVIPYALKIRKLKRILSRMFLNT